MGDVIRFSSIYKSFDNGMQALYDLNTHVQDSLGGSEWKAISEYFQEAFSLFEDYDPMEVQQILERLIKIDVEDEKLDYRKVWEAVNIEDEDIARLESDRDVYLKEIQDGLKEFARLYPEKANKFFRAFLKTQRAEPLKSEVSRQGLLLSAVSQFEFLLLNLLRAYFVFHDHDFVLQEEYSVEELDEKISQKFDKDLKFFSIHKRIDFLTSRFSISGELSRSVLDEIIERRNVFTHRNGRADNKYIKHNNRIQVGDRLRLSQNSIKDTLDNLYLWGLVLCVKVWNKLDLPDQKNISRTVSSSAMQLIRNGRYEVCAQLCQLVRSDMKTRNNRDILMLNYAVCMDRLGNKEMMLKALKKVHYLPSKPAPNLGKLSSNEPYLPIVGMACYVLMDNKEYALDLLERAVNADEVTFLDLDYWVIFDYLRDEPRFHEIENKLESKVKIV